MMYKRSFAQFVENNAERLYDPDCEHDCEEGWLVDYEGYPTPMPCSWWPCSCVLERIAPVAYYEMPEYEPMYTTHDEDMSIPF